MSRMQFATAIKMGLLVGTVASMAGCSADSVVRPGPVSGPIRYGEIRVDSAVSALRVSVSNAVDSVVAGDESGPGHYYVSSVINRSVLIVGKTELAHTVVFKAFSSSTGAPVDATVTEAAASDGHTVRGAAVVVWR